MKQEVRNRDVFRRGFSSRLVITQRVQKQLANALEKLERAQRHAEDKKLASQRTIERLQKEYDEMVLERQDNDRQVEELRREANDVEEKVIANRFCPFPC